MTESFILLKLLLSKVFPEIDLNVGLRVCSLDKMVITVYVCNGIQHVTANM